jgi:ketosteroid isomerase-like protein
VSSVSNLEDFEALEPFFTIIKQGVGGLVDGDHYFDMLTDDVVFEYVITVPGYPRRVAGRDAVAELYRPYGNTFSLHRCHDLRVHHDQQTGVVVLEYASEGHVVPTGAPYANHYISVLTIIDRKITHWRDYLDPLAVFDATGWPAHQ